MRVMTTQTEIYQQCYRQEQRNVNNRTVSDAVANLAVIETAVAVQFYPHSDARNVISASTPEFQHRVSQVVALVAATDTAAKLDELESAVRMLTR